MMFKKLARQVREQVASGVSLRIALRGEAMPAPFLKTANWWSNLMPDAYNPTYGNAGGTADIGWTPRIQQMHENYTKTRDRINKFTEQIPSIIKATGLDPDTLNVGVSPTATNAIYRPSTNDIADMLYTKHVRRGDMGISDRIVARLGGYLRNLRTYLDPSKGGLGHGYKPSDFQHSLLFNPSRALVTTSLGLKDLKPEQVLFHELAHASPEWGRNFISDTFGRSGDNRFSRLLEEARANALGAWNYTKWNPMAAFNSSNYDTFKNSMNSYWTDFKRSEQGNKLSAHLGDISRNLNRSKRWVDYLIGDDEYSVLNKYKNRFSNLNPFNEESVWSSTRRGSTQNTRRDLFPGNAREKPGIGGALSLLGNPLKVFNNWRSQSETPMGILDDLTWAKHHFDKARNAGSDAVDVVMNR